MGEDEGQAGLEVLVKEKRAAVEEETAKKLAFLGKEKQPSSMDLFLGHLERRPHPASWNPEGDRHLYTPREIDETYTSIENRSIRCRNHIIEATGLAYEIEAVFTDIVLSYVKTKHLEKGKIGEGQFQGLVKAAGKAEPHAPLWGKLAETITAAMDDIPALWSYTSFAIRYFYGLDKDIKRRECKLNTVLEHPKTKERLQELTKHIGFARMDCPLTRVLHLRNINNHEKDLFTIMTGSPYSLLIKEYFDKEWPELRGHVDTLVAGYQHFAKGYQMLLEQMHKDKNDL